MTVHNIEDQKPHVTITGFKRVHAVPISMLQDIVSGKLKLSDVDDFEDFIPILIGEWLILDKQ